MKRYNIYAGLGGSFGGAQYQYTTDCKDEDEASDLAYQAAIEEYESYEGLHGIKTWDDCRDDIAEEDDVLPEEVSDDAVDVMYNEERENWIDFYAVPTDEDTLDPAELDLRWCEDGSPSETSSSGN